MKILALYGSSRRHGNTEFLADRLLDGLEVTRIHLNELQIRPIIDQRHEPGGFEPVQDDHEAIIAQAMEHDVIIFATPLYWYGMSGQMKLFVDRWSQSLRNKGYDFRGAMARKRAFLVTTGGDQVRFKGLPLVQQFQHICDFLGMTFADYLIGTGGKPEAILQDGRALGEAAWLNQKLRQEAGL